MLSAGHVGRVPLEVRFPGLIHEVNGLLKAAVQATPVLLFPAGGLRGRLNPEAKEVFPAPQGMASASDAASQAATQASLGAFQGLLT